MRRQQQQPSGGGGEREKGRSHGTGGGGSCVVCGSRCGLFGSVGSTKKSFTIGIIVLISVYAILSSIFLTIRVYYFSTSSSATTTSIQTSENNILISNYLRSLLDMNTNNNNNSDTTTTSNSSITLSDLIDPVNNLIDTALSSLGLSTRQQQQEQQQQLLLFHTNREEYYNSFNDGLPIGILSKQNQSYFQQYQNEIDNKYDNIERCNRYGGYYDNTSTNPKKKQRRIFYGALIANEPWELYEIIASETYNLFSGIVFVESNRTQNFTPRKLQKVHHKNTFRYLFGTDNVQIRIYSNEDPNLLDLEREHEQRAEIIKGWKEIGMNSDDIGLLADSDEIFTRDFLRAVQMCDGIDALDYEQHYCHYSKVKLVASTRVFETSPECITNNREWYHPDMIIGHCIEGISDKTNIHKPAPRVNDSIYSFIREKGYGNECGDWKLEDSMPNNTYHLWNAADFRRGCGGYMIRAKQLTMKRNNNNNNNNQTMNIEPYTGYHFHNFFAQFKSTRFKYSTYGHPDPNLATKSISQISNDLKMMYKCIKNIPDSDDQKWKHTIGGFKSIKPFVPIYFNDDDYRYRRHEHVQEMVREDEQLLQDKLMQEQVEQATTITADSSTNNAPNADAVTIVEQGNNHAIKTETNGQSKDPTIRVVSTLITEPNHDPTVSTISENDTGGADNDNYDKNKEEFYKSFNDSLPIGLLSKQSPSFFRNIQNEIDNMDNIKRCKRYGGYYNVTNPQKRRIFYGALAASEPWELYEIVAAEVYGIYEGMVFVEGNRTQNFTPRKFQRLQHAKTFEKIFGTSKVQVRAFVNEDKKLEELYREHAQRAEILIGWKELGMQSEDIGLLADADETFTRDFLRAAQVCDGIELLDYDKHHCHHSYVKLVAATKVFETSPECITKDREWFHPDMIIGHCIEGISSKTDLHKPAPRVDEPYTFLREKGWGLDCDWSLEDQLPNNTYHLWNGADFRRGCGGYMVHMKDNHRYVNGPQGTKLDYYTGFHFHNFFAQFKSTRFKYQTYGHADPDQANKAIHEMSNDLKMMYNCAMNITDDKDQFWKRTVGGYNALKPFYPIYFQDSDYRKRRHAYVQEMVKEDDQLLNERRMAQQIEKDKQT